MSHRHRLIYSGKQIFYAQPLKNGMEQAVKLTLTLLISVLLLILCFQWHARAYVRQTQLVILDEIHLLGQDRGPILEVIVSRMRYISTQTGIPVRIIGFPSLFSSHFTSILMTFLSFDHFQVSRQL